MLAALLPPLLAALAPPAGAAGVQRRALVVGNNDGGGELEPLRYAEEDALRFAQVLEELGGYAPGDLTVLLSPDPEAVAEQLSRIAGELPEGEDSLFLFYYSGHADAEGLRLGGEVLPYEALKAGIREVPAGVHLGVLDACRSGAISRVKGASISSPFLPDGDDEALAAEGEVWLTASAADEDAQESDTLGSSFFTYYLISGLRGAADTGGDGVISLSEAYAYAYDRTVARTGGTQVGAQHPTYDFQLRGEGDLRLTQVQSATARLTLPEALSGEIIVLRQPEGRPVAEVSKIPGKAVTLALEPGRYLLRRRQGGALQEASLSLSTGSIGSVTAWADVLPELGGTKGPADEPTPEGLDLSSSPVLAGAASAVLPGAGQAYNGDWLRGALFLGGILSLSGTGYGLNAVHDGAGFTGNPLGPNPATMLGTMLYGWSIADAAGRARGLSRPRPRAGLTASLESDWIDDPEHPSAAGLALDWIVSPGLSLGLDRSGYTRQPDGSWDAALGGRMMIAGEGERLRPGAFVAAGLRAGSAGAGEPPLRQVFAGGFNLRWYINPRYFVGYTLRYEQDAGRERLSHGGGLGVHLGG